MMGVMMRRPKGVAWMVACAMGGAASGVLPEYVPIEVGTIAGASRVFVTGINNNGLVVGTCSFSNGSFRAWAWSPSEFRQLPTLGGNLAKAYGVNNRGDIVGESTITGIKFGRACMWRSDGQLINLGTLGGAGSWAISINENREIVGRSWITGNTMAHAFLYRNGVMTDLGVLPGPTNYYSAANAINATGTIVGLSDGTSGYPNPTLWEPTQLTNLAPTSVSGEALSVNDNGVIVGIMRWGQLDQATAFTRTGPVNLGRLASDTEGVCNDVNNLGQAVGNSARPSLSRAVLWRTLTPNTQVDLNTRIAPGSGWQLADAMDINDAGWIVGTGTRNGLPRGYVLIPRCVADVDNGSHSSTPDGGVNVDDLLHYLVMFEIGSADADITDGRNNPVPDGGVNVDDLLYYLTRFESGC